MTPGSSVGFGLGDEQVALDTHGRSTGMTSEWKKAIVTLAEGERIEFFQGV